MWSRTSFDSLDTRSQRHANGRLKRAADRRGKARRLFLEALEDRSLMAFNPLADYATGISPVDLALAQINPGSQPDLVVVNYSDSTVSVRLGNGDGTFGSALVSATGAYPSAVAAGDVTGDGATDLVTANSTDVTLLVGNGDGSFQAPQSLSLPPQISPANPDPTPLAQNPRSVAVGDLNGDGKLDLVVAADTFFTQKVLTCWYYGCGYSYYGVTDGYVNVLIGNGSGGFGASEVHPLGTNRSPSAIAISKINGDANADVITANNGDLSVLLGDGAGALGGPINSSYAYGSKSISLGDVDGDGKTDALASGWSGLIVQKGNGNGTFTPQSVSADIPVSSAVMGDVNSDGKIDLIAAGSNNNFICTSSGYYGCYDGYWTATRLASVVLGNGSGGFSLPLVSNLGGETGYSSLPDLAVSDLTSDGRPDFVTIDASAYAVLVATNDGDWNPPPSIVISDAATVVEGNSGTVNAVFTVSIVGSHSGSVSVNYSTADYTAIGGADYTTTSGTLTFGPSDSSLTISVPVRGDTIDEYDEQFYVNLSSAVGGVITDFQGVGTIQDDDAAPLVKINDVSKSEGNSGNTSFVFTVSLSAVSGKYIYVNFATANGSATTADSDYFAASGTVYFAPGQTTTTITVIVRGDKKKETNETFFVNLTGATDGTISDSQGLGTILNDDNGNGVGKGKPSRK